MGPSCAPGPRSRLGTWSGVIFLFTLPTTASTCSDGSQPSNTLTASEIKPSNALAAIGNLSPAEVLDRTSIRALRSDIITLAAVLCEFPAFRISVITGMPTPNLDKDSENYGGSSTLISIILKDAEGGIEGYLYHHTIEVDLECIDKIAEEPVHIEAVQGIVLGDLQDCFDTLHKLLMENMNRDERAERPRLIYEEGKLMERKALRRKKNVDIPTFYL